MSATSYLDTIIQKYVGVSENDLQNATWEEVDQLAKVQNGTSPCLQRMHGTLYASSPYVMAGRFGSLEESNERWNKIGEGR